MQFTLKFPTKNEKTDEKYPKLRTELRTFEKSKYITALPTLSNLYAAASAALWPSREFGGIAAGRRGGRKRERGRDGCFYGQVWPGSLLLLSTIPPRPPLFCERVAASVAARSTKFENPLLFSLSLCAVIRKTRDGGIRRSMRR